ncbi:MAG: glycosyltransferase [Candidatus Aenigmatarchaeota archaeon]
MIKYFVYVTSPLSPHFVHHEWAKSIGCKDLKIPINPFLQFYYSEKIEEFLKNLIKGGQEVLFVVESLYALPFIYKIKRSFKTKVKIVSIIADTSFYPPKYSLIRRIYFNFFKLKDFVDYYIVVSNKIKNWMVERNIEDSKIFVVRPFSIIETKKREVLNKEINNNIVFIGNYTKIRAAKRVLKLSYLLKDFNFYIVGSVCKALNIKRKNNVFCTYNLTWNELKKLLLSSTIYIHPFEFDPFPVSVIDAMRCGNYPLVYSYVGTSEILNKENILRTLDIKKWEKKIVDIRNSISKKDFIKYYKISLNHTKEKSIEEFRKVIEKII